MMLTSPIFKALASIISFIPLASSAPSPLDIIDLGYAKHIISFTNTTPAGNEINVYKNIRFAQPPVGNNRFFNPVTPPVTVVGIQNGDYDFDTRCVSAVPYGAGVLFPGLNGTSFGQEDCLFLDVYVPQNTVHSSNLPVIHWIYGSGYAFGSKEMLFTPLGLLDVGIQANKPFILVASNYRMGLYGWVASPAENMDANTGLWDSLIALQWTQEHITKFGGDPSRVTAMGQSSSAGMIEMLATSTMLHGVLPFQQAFLSSPAMPLKKNETRRQEVYDAVLNATSCTSLECLRNLSTDELAEANRYLLNDVPSLSGGGNQGPGIGFGPVVDDNLVPALPYALQNLTKVASGLQRLITANMDNEGTIVSSDKDMPEAFPNLVRRIIPTVSNETIASIQSMYTYPPDLPEMLAWEWTTDAAFRCHALALSEALQDRTRRYVMTIPPAWHGQDQSYFFFSDNETTPVVSIDMAKDFQTDIVDFVFGDAEGLDAIWPVFGSDKRFLNITTTGFEVNRMSESQMSRCKYINALFADARNGL